MKGWTQLAGISSYELIHAILPVSQEISAILKSTADGSNAAGCSPVTGLSPAETDQGT